MCIADMVYLQADGKKTTLERHDTRRMGSSDELAGSEANLTSSQNRVRNELLKQPPARDKKRLGPALASASMFHGAKASHTKHYLWEPLESKRFGSMCRQKEDVGEKVCR